MNRSSTKRTKQPDFDLTDFVVIADTREQSPFAFAGMKSNASRRGKQLIVRQKTATLKTGDYSIEGMEDRITIERKSFADAYGTFTRGRDRFERELERMAEMEFAAVVVEAGWRQILKHPPGKCNAKSFFRSVLAWQMRYGVHFMPMPNRRTAEIATFRMLERYWNDRSE